MITSDNYGGNAPGCNTIGDLVTQTAGFGSSNTVCGPFREDAILVVVIVTDDPPFDYDMDDAHPNTDTSGWFDAVVAAKSGDAESIVMIGFVPLDPLATCTFGISPNLIGFIEEFGEQGVLASICEPDYSPIFASSIETIESTYDNFIPQG